MTPEQIEVEGMRLVAPQPTEEMLIGRAYNDAILASIDNRPLLAQCAALIDSLLGGPVVGNGIIDEIRRVRAELAKEGW